MLMRVAEVKCYNCGRTCGEISAQSLHDLTLDNIRVPEYTRRCGLSKGTTLRCERCGGSVYIDQPFTAGAGELIPTREAV